METTNSLELRDAFGVHSLLSDTSLIESENVESYMTTSFYDDGHCDLAGLRVFEKKSGETVISLNELSEYKGLKKGQVFSVKYQEICRSSESQTKNGFGLNFSETIVSGLKDWIVKFYKGLGRCGVDIHDQLLNLKVSFILRDRGRTKVYLEFVR
ncbi:MAG: hypothetical protein ACK5N8_08410 [Alphaproteobacteria bacterium]